MSELYNTSVQLMIMFAPVLTAIFTLVSRNPVSAILWRIATFIITCGIVFYNYALGFTCSLIIIVYIGAIAIRFRFIVMMVPMKERYAEQHTLVERFSITSVVTAIYVGACSMMTEKMYEGLNKEVAEFWSSINNQQDVQNLFEYLNWKDNPEGYTVWDLQYDDLALYGARFYSEAAYPILITGLVLLFVLVAAIVLCQDQ